MNNILCRTLTSVIALLLLMNQKTLAQNPAIANSKIHWMTQGSPAANNSTTANFLLDNATVATVSRAVDNVTLLFRRDVTWTSGPYNGDLYRGLQINGNSANNSTPNIDITFPAGFNPDGVVLALSDLAPNFSPAGGGAVLQAYTLVAVDATNAVIASTTWAPSGGWSNGNTDGNGGCTNAVVITNLPGNTGLDLRPQNGGSSCLASSAGFAVVISSPDVRTIRLRKVASGAGDAILLGLGILSDAGDAPTSYTTLWDNIGTAGGPWHRMRADATGAPESILKMGATEVMNGNGLPGANANLDADEDGATFRAVSTTAVTVTNYTATVALTNTTGSTANLYGWIDWNNNGIFDATERVNTTVANGATSAVLTWPSATVVNVSNRLYARLRLTTATLTAPTGGAPDGEVEDYRITMTPPQPISGSVLNDNNGQTGGVNGQPVAGATVTLFGPDGTTVVATTTTDANGNYSFANVNADDYTVGITPPAGFSNVSSSDGTTPTDGRTAVTVGTVPVTGVNFGVNQRPAVTNDTLTHQQGGTPATIANILVNDTDPNNGTLSPDSISLVAPAGATGVVVDPQGDTVGFTVPGQGVWALNSTTGAVTFTPAAGFTGDPTPINYTVTDAAGLVSNVGTIVIDYDYPPVAVNDTATTPMNTPLNANVTPNDTCRDGPCSYSPLASDPPTHGTLTINTDGSYTYTPTTGFVGNDTFSYVVCNSVTPTPLCDTAMVFITVDGPPVAVNDTTTTPINTPVNGNMATNDTCGNAPCLYTTTPSTPPTNGTVTINSNGTYTYTPTTGFVGTDSFTYVVCDADNDCDTAMVFITVDGPPVAVNDSVTTPINTPVNGNMATNDTCGNAACLYTTTPSTPPTNGTVTINTDGSYTYTPTTGFVGIDSFTYVVCDADNDCDTAMVVITVSDPLPVDLLEFRIDRIKDCHAVLYWKTGKEVAVSRFEIEQSTDARTFAAVGKVNTQGSGSVYQYEAKLVNGTNYFRLKTVDHDQAYQLSDVVSVQTDCNSLGTIRIYPTRASDKITIEGLQNGSTIQVFDMNGKQVYKAQATSASHFVAVQQYAAGVYNVVITTAQSEMIVERFVKP